MSGGGYNYEDFPTFQAQAKSGILYGNLEAPIGTVSFMPQGGTTRLPDCEISQIKAWIDQGAQNN